MPLASLTFATPTAALEAYRTACASGLEDDYEVAAHALASVVRVTTLRRAVAMATACRPRLVVDNGQKT